MHWRAGIPLHTDLAGTNEVPPADLTATGTAQLWLNPGQGTVCYALTASGLSAPAVAAHVMSHPPARTVRSSSRCRSPPTDQDPAA